MVMFAVGAVWCLAEGALSVRRKRTARQRREALLGVDRPRRVRWPRSLSSRRVALREWAVAGATGIAVAALFGGLPGVGIAVVATYGIRRRQRRGRARATPDTDSVARQLPLAADLLAACLAAGGAPGQAAEAVGRTVQGPLGEALRQVAAELRLGGEPAHVWARLAVVPGADGLARWMARAATTGVPPVAAVTRLAAEYRSAGSRSASAGARKAAVLATAPLGVCFLPAFLAVGVVPVVIGLAVTMTQLN
jgi:pilus assembly protein TadC